MISHWHMTHVNCDQRYTMREKKQNISHTRKTGDQGVPDMHKREDLTTIYLISGSEIKVGAGWRKTGAIKNTAETTTETNPSDRYV